MIYIDLEYVIGNAFIETKAKRISLQTIAKYGIAIQKQLQETISNSCFYTNRNIMYTFQEENKDLFSFDEKYIYLKDNANIEEIKKRLLIEAPFPVVKVSLEEKPLSILKKAMQND